ncbi:MAG: hypothetical protein LBT05_11405 [Planctomycetaceae bacterium]|jgi:hypothetical protein|nr:hypothetical protein [Planctomycetaceae bacterium]
MKVLLQNSDPNVQLAYDKYLQFNQDEELRQIEDARQQYLHDYATDIEYARREGEAIGIEKGIEKGIETLLRILTKRFGETPPTLCCFSDVIYPTLKLFVIPSCGSSRLRGER